MSTETMTANRTSEKSSAPYPGKLVTADGSEAVVAAEILACSGGGAYPITPATNMGVGFEQAVADGKKNAWGETLAFFEPESEHAAASVCEGYALAGGRVSNFTAGQGLLLMKEVLYVISGKRLPMVFHIAARALTHHSLNVHAGHDDVMGVVDCGWGMLFARNAQEAGDFALIARRAAEEGCTPFFNIQDGFLTSHTVQSLRVPEAEMVKAYLRTPDQAVVNLMDTKKPIMSGVVQNQDAYMKGRVASRMYYKALKQIVSESMEKFAELTGRKYGLIDTYKMEDAEYAIVGMGSFMETAQSTVDWIREHMKIKVGVVSVISYRPFPAHELVATLKNCKAISVLERLDDLSSPENPLVRDIKAAFADAAWGRPDYPQSARVNKIPVIQGGSGGLGGRDVRASDIIAIAENLKKGAEGKLRYCVGIDHEDALQRPAQEPDIRPKGSFSVIGFSIGGLGSVTTNKVIAGVCADLFGMWVQAFPKYGAEKKGLPTNYYLTVGNHDILSHQELRNLDLVVVNDLNAFRREDPMAGLRDGGYVILQVNTDDKSKIWNLLPDNAVQKMKEKKLKVYALNAQKIASEVTHVPSLQLRMQGIVLLGAFLRATPFATDRGLSREQLKGGIEKVIRKYFGKRGESVVQDNLTCVTRGYEEIMELA